MSDNGTLTASDDPSATSGEAEKQCRVALFAAFDKICNGLRTNRILLQEAPDQKSVEFGPMGYANMHHAYKVAFNSAFMEVSGISLDYELGDNRFIFPGGLEQLSNVQWNRFQQEWQKEVKAAYSQNISIYRS